MDKSPRRYFYQPEASVRTQTIRMLVSSLQGGKTGNDSNLLIVFYVQIMPDDFVMQLHRF
ncbi:hypothetical protein A1WO_04308 [Escherichia coli KTE102]|nr:hypothetical protein A1WO_04308 [Escherichia coli KTE102]